MTNPVTTATEIAEQAIDFIEELGYSLDPWQATTLRAILTYPVRTRFAVAPPPQHPHTVSSLNAATSSQRKGFRSDHVVMDEGCTGIHRTMDDLRDCPAHGDRHL